MIAHYMEAYNDFNHGKFVLVRHDAADLARRSALPGYTDAPLLAGRKFGHDETFVIDLQTGEGCAFVLEGGADGARFTLNCKHQVWVCPLFEPFVCWLAGAHPELSRGGGDLAALPAIVELAEAPRAMSGHRRTGSPT